MWDNMEDLQMYIKKLGMNGAIYEEDFGSPTLGKFTAGMRDPFLQQLQSLHTQWTDLWTSVYSI